MQSHSFRVGNRVAIVTGEWAGSSGTIVSITPDRSGARDDAIKIHCEATTLDALAMPRELKRLSN